MWDLIDELVRSGMTTLLTTQYLEEADRLADEIAVIDHGTVIERGTAAELKRRVGGDQIEVVVTDPATVHDAIARLAEFSVGEAHVDGDGRHVLVPVHDVRGLVPRVVRALDEAGIDVQDVGVRHSTLDDVFFALTGHAAEEEKDDESEPERETVAAGGAR